MSSSREESPDMEVFEPLFGTKLHRAVWQAVQRRKEVGKDIILKIDVRGKLKELIIKAEDTTTTVSQKLYTK